MSIKMEVFLRTAMLKDDVARMPGATMKEEVSLSGEICWMDIEKGKKHVVVEIRKDGFGVSDLDNVVGFEGPEHVYEYGEDARTKIVEILNKGS